MRIRRLIVAFVGVLLVSSVSLAQELAPAARPFLRAETEQSPSQVTGQRRQDVRSALEPSAPMPAPRVAAVSRTRTRPSTGPMEVRIFQLKYISAREMANLVRDVFKIDAYPDNRTSSLIVNATEEEIKSVGRLIQEMDVPDPDASTRQDSQDLVYRVYMFEIASADRDMKPFSMILQVSPEMSTTYLLDAARDDELQIGRFSLSDELDSDGKAEILIQGRAASDEALKRVVAEDILDSESKDLRIKELVWDDAETFTDKIAAAHHTQLPKQMQKHIAKLLGDDIRTVGYWFGNSSVPGEIDAPIGPWTLKLDLDDTESDRMLELWVQVDVPEEIHGFETRLGRQRNDTILSNIIRTKIGKPIIIGYNRESYGTRKMGAMVILPEEDTIQSSTSETNAL